MTLWSGRFETDPAEVLWEFTVDTSDRRLLGDDVAGSLAHVRMLGRAGVLTGAEVEALIGGLEQVATEAAAGTFVFTDQDEDVHTAVERRLGELIGPVAGKVHTGRSRNDQVALDLRLYLRRACDERISDLAALGGVLVDQAESVGATSVASYTHLQQAQVVPLAHHLLAYAWMVMRDIERFQGVRDRIDRSPLGAGAGGGTSLPLDPKVTAADLGFAAVFDNSMDAVASRDVVAEFAFVAAQAMVHLSRLGEELVLWSTAEFGWISVDDAFMTGSSAMPQKRNPDVAELARGKAAGVIGDVTTLLTVQKGLPLTYNRDLQEDKRAVFHCDDVLAGSLAAVTGMVAATRFHPPPPHPDVLALDLAELLVRRGVAFREAHAAVGGLVTRMAQEGRTLGDATDSDLASASDAFSDGDAAALGFEASLQARVSPGGGSMRSVETQIQALRSRLS